MDRRFLTPGELANLLQLRPSTIKSWAREGRIPSLRFSKGVVRFELDAVTAALKSISQSACTDAERKQHPEPTHKPGATGGAA
jgi:excisionase family DNA binding protein